MDEIAHTEVADAAVQAKPPRHRPVLPVLLAFCIGIALDALMPAPSGAWLIVFGVAVPGAVWGIRRGLQPWGYWLLTVVLLVPAGAFWHAARFREKPEWHLEHLLRDAKSLYYVRGKVAQEADLHYRWAPFGAPDENPGEFWLLRVRVSDLSGDGEQWQRAEGGVAVFGEMPPPEVQVGDTVQVLAALKRNAAPTNPGERDRRLQYESMGSYATASVSSAAAIKVLERGHWYSSPTAAVGRLRSSVWAHVKPALEQRGAGPGAIGLVAALLFGRRGALPASESDQMRESGVLHFLAISGLHVGIFCAFCTVVLTMLGVPVRARLVLTMALVWGYILFTGAHTSAVRAGLVITLIMSAPLLERQADNLSALAVAALATLVWRPEQLFSAGFQLTFIAVWGILVIYPQMAGILWPWEDLLERLRHPAERTLAGDLWRGARSYLLLSLVVWGITAPIRAFHFHVLCWVAPILNLLVWPLVLALLVTCFALAGSAIAWGFLSGPIAGLAVFWAESIRSLLQWSEGLPGFGDYVASPPVWWVVLFFVAAGIWTVRSRLPFGRRTFVATALFLGAAYIGASLPSDRSRRFELTVADVGHGQAVLARVPTGEVLLFDAGSQSKRAESAVADVMWAQDVRRVHAATVSHYNSALRPPAVPRSPLCHWPTAAAG